MNEETMPDHDTDELDLANWEEELNRPIQPRTFAAACTFADSLGGEVRSAYQGRLPVITEDAWRCWVEGPAGERLTGDAFGMTLDAAMARLVRVGRRMASDVMDGAT